MRKMIARNIVPSRKSQRSSTDIELDTKKLTWVKGGLKEELRRYPRFPWRVGIALIPQSCDCCLLSLFPSILSYHSSLKNVRNWGSIRTSKSLTTGIWRSSYGKFGARLARSDLFHKPTADATSYQVEIIYKGISIWSVTTPPGSPSGTLNYPQ